MAGLFAVSYEINLGGDWTALRFFVVLLVVLYLLFTVFAGLRSASERMNNTLWPAILGVVALIGVVLLGDFRESEADTVRFSAETDRLSVESGRSGVPQQPGQTEWVPDSFCQSGVCWHEHDGYGMHSHLDE